MMRLQSPVVDERDETDTDQERRTELRKAISLAASVSLPSGEFLHGQTVDLSTSGVGLYSAKPLSADQLCKLDIELSACGSTYKLSLMASVCYSQPDATGRHRVGMRFVGVDARNVELIRSLIG